VREPPHRRPAHERDLARVVLADTEKSPMFVERMKCPVRLV
jgi:hypothetical protein